MLMNAKTYLKALQNSSQASKLFSESLAKLAENAQATPGATDIGMLILIKGNCLSRLTLAHCHTENTTKKVERNFFLNRFT
jgi:hypothetical protein